MKRATRAQVGLRMQMELAVAALDALDEGAGGKTPV